MIQEMYMHIYIYICIYGDGEENKKDRGGLNEWWDGEDAMGNN